VNFDPSDSIDLPPTVMKTLGKIVFAAISLDNPSDGPAVPRYE